MAYSDPEKNREYMREYMRKYRAARPTKADNIQQDKALAWRGEDNREHRLEYARAYYKANKENLDARNRAWAKANPEKALEYGRKSQKANPNPEKCHRYRARKRNVPSTQWTKQQVIDTYGRVCWICEYPLDCDFHVDHVIPLAKGGWNVLANLRPAHSTCNIRKNAKMPPAIMQGRVWYELGVWHAGLTCE